MCEKCKELEKENVELKIALKREQLRLLEAQSFIISNELKELASKTLENDRG